MLAIREWKTTNKEPSTWKEAIQEKMDENKDNWNNIIQMNPNEPRWLTDPDSYKDCYGRVGWEFIIWTKDYIYFSAAYDGGHWTESYPRNPDKDFEPYFVGGGW